MSPIVCTCTVRSSFATPGISANTSASGFENASRSPATMRMSESVAA